MVFGKGIAKGLMTVVKHVRKPVVTVQFPEEERDIPPRARTNLVICPLVWRYRIL